MGDAAARAAELVRKADKKLASFSFFGNKYEDAGEWLEKAAVQFKLAQAWADAGATYEKLAAVHLKLDSKHEAASSYMEAAKCYQKTDKKDVLRALHNAVEYYTEIGRLSMAAKNLREAAETLEKQGLKEDAIEFYLRAAELYAGEEQSSEANKCRLKVAQFAAELERYSEAIEVYEGVARASVDNNLLKYSAKGYLLNAGICQLCSARPGAHIDKLMASGSSGDEVAIRSALERYEDIDMNFAGSREAKLLKDLADACEAGDSEAFTDALGEYDNMTRLDAWKTALLLRVKKRMAAAEDGDEPDLT